MKNAIREAYEQARQERSHKDPAPERPLPPWEQLPLEMREALIAMFYAGRLNAFQEKDSDVVREILADADVRNVEQLHDRIAELKAALHQVLASGALNDGEIRDVVRSALGEK